MSQDNESLRKELFFKIEKESRKGWFPYDRYDRCDRCDR